MSLKSLLSAGFFVGGRGGCTGWKPGDFLKKKPAIPGLRAFVEWLLCSHQGAFLKATVLRLPYAAFQKM